MLALKVLIVLGAGTVRQRQRVGVSATNPPVERLFRHFPTGWTLDDAALTSTTKQTKIHTQHTDTHTPLGSETHFYGSNCKHIVHRLDTRQQAADD